MKVLAALAVAVSADFDQVTAQWAQPKPNPFPANPNAPYCGCQVLIDPAEVGGYINKTCTIKFPYADEINFGKTAGNDPHFVSVASTYIVGRKYSDDNIDGFVFTGFDEVSNPDVLDVLVFYDQDDCYRPGLDPNDPVYDPDSEEYDQSKVWELYNMTTAQTEMLCEYELSCEGDGDEKLGGVYLGNFNYDIARSVQTYTVPIYGLPKGEAVDFDLHSYENEPVYCANAAAHAGHGSIADGSCSNNVTETCDNVITFVHDQGHNGLLEYFQFEPVGPTNMGGKCWEPPAHHDDDYEWQTPSPWDTQQYCMDYGVCKP